MAPRNSPELTMLYDKEKQKGNANRATLAVARKLVAYLMAVDRGQRERLVETVKLRNALIREAAKLLLEAIRQAKPKGGRKRKDGTRTPARAGSAALLRLIARLAMRDIRLDRKK